MLTLVQSHSPHRSHTLGTAAADSWFKNICSILAENQVPCTLWAKFDGRSPWQAAIANYSKTGLLQQLYWCRGGTSLETAAGLRLDPQVTITPLLLEIDTHWQGESFFCFLSKQISLLVLFQEDSESSKTVEVVQSFSPQTIDYFLRSLKQVLAVGDDLPSELFNAETLPETANLSLINQLLQGSLSGVNTPIKSAQNYNDPAIAKPFVVNLIRELGIPLTNTKTALQLLESFQQKKEARQRYLDLIKQNCDRQASLITGLRELLEITSVPPPVEAVSIEDCVVGVVGIYQPIALEKAITLEYNVVENCSPAACTTADLRAILQRLLENALKFTPSRGKVQVRAYDRKQRVEIVVSDQGCGIAMADIPHLFDCFFRGQNVPTESQGAGVGLTIVQSLVQRWGGEITVRSRLGNGSYFHIFLPIVIDNSPGHRFITPQ